MNKSIVIVAVIVTVLLTAAVSGLYFYGKKKAINDSVNKLNAAKSLYENSQWPEAEHLFTEILRKYPRADVVPECLYYVAIMMQAEGNYEKALEKWRTLAETENNLHRIEGDYNIGFCLEMLSRQPEAVTQYSRVAGMQQAGEFAALAKAGLGRIAQEDGNLEKAIELFREARALAGSSETIDIIEKSLGDSNMRMLMLPVESKDKEAYLIQAGDSLVAIAIDRNSTVDLLCRINNIQNPAQIRLNQRILIPHTDFSIKIDKSDFKLTLFNHDRFFKSYKVGLGKDGRSPVGEFIIDNKEKNPTWWSPNGPIPPNDPGNELGTRWMGLKPLTPGIGPDYGIHGTIDPSTIGWESSNGCPRMYPAEAEELYMLVTIGTPVKIEE